MSPLPPLPPPDRAVPVLAVHARRSIDPLTRRPLLLYPEGVLELEETAAAILDLCDGRRSLDAIAAALADDYDAPREEIARDVDDYVRELAAKGLLRFRERPA